MSATRSDVPLSACYRSGADREGLQLRAGREGAVCHRRRVRHGSRSAQHAPGAVSGEGGPLRQNGPHQRLPSAQAHPPPQLCRSVMFTVTGYIGFRAILTRGARSQVFALCVGKYRKAGNLSQMKSSLWQRSNLKLWCEVLDPLIQADFIHKPLPAANKYTLLQSTAGQDRSAQPESNYSHAAAALTCARERERAYICCSFKI